MPYELLFAIQHANRICDWQENMLSEECPPQWMWPFNDELEAWFDDVDAARKARYGGESNDDTEVPMMANELAKGRGRNA